MAIVKLGILLIIIITIIMIAVIKLYDTDEYARKTQTDEYKEREEKVRRITKKTVIIIGIAVLMLVISIIMAINSKKIADALLEAILDSCAKSCEESLCGPGHHEYSCAALFTAINNCK
jgi:Na+/H+ antiporter NhaC